MRACSQLHLVACPRALTRPGEILCASHLHEQTAQLCMHTPPGLQSDWCFSCSGCAKWRETSCIALARFTVSGALKATRVGGGDETLLAGMSFLHKSTGRPQAFQTHDQGYRKNANCDIPGKYHIARL